MQSSNPVFRKNDGFNGRAVATAPADWQIDLDGGPGGQALVGTGRMTIDSVVEKTAITLGVVVVAAALSWFWIGSAVDEFGAVDSSALQKAYMLTLIGGLGGFALSLVNSFKRVVSPALVIAYAALEGLFVGGFSNVLSRYVGDTSIVFGAVLGTLAALGGTLAAYKFFNIQVGARFRKIVIASMFGFVAVSLLDFVMSFFNASFGFNGLGPLGLISSIIGVVIAVFMLILDFDFVENGVRAGLPEVESWRAAFALTVTIIWLYTEILRILAILRGGD